MEYLKLSAVKKNTTNLNYLNMIAKYDKIIIGGQALDYCVLTSLQQIVEFYENQPEILRKIYLLTDCCSAVDPFNLETHKEYTRIKTQYEINFIQSIDLKL